MDAESFWERTKELIKTNNMTQRGLSETIGLNPRALEIKINRHSIPDAIEALKIAQALNTTVEYLVTGKEPEQANEYESLKKAIQNVLKEF